MEKEIKIMTGLSKFKEFMIKLKKNNIITKNMSEYRHFIGKLKRGPEEGESWTRIGYAMRLKAFRRLSIKFLAWRSYICTFFLSQKADIKILSRIILLLLVISGRFLNLVRSPLTTLSMALSVYLSLLLF